MEEGYPAYVIYIVLGIGTLLLFYRPYWVLYGIILLICSIDLQAAIYTRTPLAGPYLNLMDALLLELLLTMFFILKAQMLPFLWIREVGLVLLVLIVSAITIGLRESYEYEVIREIRWTLSFPIAFIVMANVVRTGKEIIPLLFCVLIGAGLAATQHIYYVLTVGLDRYFSSLNVETIRTISFISCGLYILSSSLSIKLPKKVYYSILYYAILACILISTVLTQTRSLWIATVITVAAISALQRKFKQTMKYLLIVTVVVLIAQFIFSFIFPWLDPVELVLARSQTLNADNDSAFSRWRMIEVELGAFYDYNWLTGLGIGFHHFLPEGDTLEVIAWGHVGHVAYLTRLGIVGSFIYSIYIPYQGLKKAITLSKAVDILDEEWNADSTMLLICVACIICDWVIFFMSGSYLSLTPIPGIFYGILWGIYNTKLNKPIVPSILQSKLKSNTFN